MKLRSTTIALSLSLLAIAAVSCSDEESPNNAAAGPGAGDTSSGAGAGSGTGGSLNQPTYVGTAGVYVTQVAIYQGVKRVLMLDGAAQTSSVPMIAGRDALIRVFYATDANYTGGEVTGR